MRTPKIIEDAIEEPLTVAECRTHLEAQAYEDSDVDPLDDAMIEGFLAAAREHCEAFLGLSLATKVLEIALDTFPDDGEAIDLPNGPVRDVYSVSWGDDSDDEMAAASYVLDTYRNPNQLRPLAAAWPSVTASPAIVKIRYEAGYGTSSDSVQIPKILRAAILIEMANLYENRGDGEISMHAANLLRPFRVRLGMA